MASNGSLRVLRESRFRRYWLGQTASRLGSGLVAIATVFTALDLTGSATQVGAVFAVGTFSEVGHRSRHREPQRRATPVGRRSCPD